MFSGRAGHFGLLTADEASLAISGGTSHFLYSGRRIRTMSPRSFSTRYAFEMILSYQLDYDGLVSNEFAVRPVVSIRQGVSIATGDGSKEYPWELELP